MKHAMKMFAAGVAVMVFAGGFTASQLANPVFDASDFENPQENPYFPLRPGTVYFYETPTEDGLETSVFTVTYETKEILGVDTIVVHDKEYLDGELVEDTFDWFGIDEDGNVWYFGEDSAEIENGEVVSTSGSWQAGQNGAMPGIIMLGDPDVGELYLEELSPGEAEDTARVVSLNKSVKVHPDWPYASTKWPFVWTPFSGPSSVFKHCLKTRNWNPLDPGPVEWKYYAPGVGPVMEVTRDEDGNFERKRLTNVILP